MAADDEATPQETYAALQTNGVALFDVREPWENEQERIPGAVLIPLGELADRVGEIPADRDVYVHCRGGGRSGRAVAFLRENGRPRARNVTGGIEAWKEAGLPVNQ
ncbi:MAG: rhodanese-like domain-containing protein [Candidatus Dormibacteraeota bacterium]|nr:rhodanese-like domain-containing protein [Candidatus Dormibacteraeota bacterium]